MGEKTERQVAQNSRGKKIRRRAWQKLRESHPDECVYHQTELDGRTLAKRYPAEFWEAKKESKGEIYEELGPIPGDPDYKEFQSNESLTKYKSYKTLGARVQELEDRVRALEKRETENDLDDLEEI